MSTLLEKQVLEANESYAAGFDSGGLDINPKNKLVIDCRLDPAAAYGFKLGDTIVVRNASASARDDARSALLTTHVLDVEDIYIIKHERCSLLSVTFKIAYRIIKNLGLTQSKTVDEFEVLPIANLEASAKEDVAFLRNHPLMLNNTRVTGWVYDTDSGILIKVIE